MFMKRGSRTRFSLVDGSALSGEVQFSWRFRTWRLKNVVVHHPSAGDVPAEGYVLLPHRSVLLMQVIA